MSAKDASADDIEIYAATPQLASALIGPIIAGAAVQLMLYGIFITAFVHYAGSSAMHSHSKRMRTALWIVAALTTFQTGLCFEELFRLAVSQNRTVDAILKASWQLAIAPLVTGIVGAICTSILTSRASSLFTSDWAKWTYRGVVGLFIFASLWACVLVTAIGFMYLNGTEDQALPLTFNIGVAAWLWLAMATDVSISVGLYWNLRSRAAHTTNTATRSILSTLVKTAVLTASYTSFVSIAGALVSVIYHESALSTTDVQYAFHLPLASLYALSLLVTLFSRQRVSARLAREPGATMADSGGSWDHNGNGGQRRRTPLRIEVQTQRSIIVEENDNDDERPERDPSDEERKEGMRQVPPSHGAIPHFLSPTGTT